MQMFHKTHIVIKRNNGKYDFFALIHTFENEHFVACNKEEEKIFCGYNRRIANCSIVLQLYVHMRCILNAKNCSMITLKNYKNSKRF